jgi:hypothetical protein
MLEKINNTSIILSSEDIINTLPKSNELNIIIYDNIAFSWEKHEYNYLINIIGYSTDYESFNIVINHIYNYLKQIERTLKLNLIC